MDFEGVFSLTGMGTNALNKNIAKIINNIKGINLEASRIKQKIISTDYQVKETDRKLLINSTNTSINLIFTAVSLLKDGDWFQIDDYSKNCNTYPINIDLNGNTVDGLTLIDPLSIVNIKKVFVFFNGEFTSYDLSSGNGILRYSSTLNFPLVGSDAFIYLDMSTFSMWFFDSISNIYFNPVNGATIIPAPPILNYTPPNLTNIFGAINGADKFMLYFANQPQDGTFNSNLDMTFEITSLNPSLNANVFVADNTYTIPSTNYVGKAFIDEILENGIPVIGDIINMGGTNRKRVTYPAGVFWTRYKIGNSFWSNNYNFIITPTVDQTSGITPDPLSATNGFISGTGIYGGQFYITRENIANFMTTSGIADFTYEITSTDPAIGGFIAHHTYKTNYVNGEYYDQVTPINLFENGIDVSTTVMGGLKGISTLSAGNYWTRYKIGNSLWSNTLPFTLLPYQQIVF